MANCDRCGREMNAWRTSWFNTETICILLPDSCADRETAHPRIKEAVDADVAAIGRGNFNYPGIGLPPDLRPSTEEKHEPNS